MINNDDEYGDYDNDDDYNDDSQKLVSACDNLAWKLIPW